jgi:molybdopterin-containing oxidoreductase family iron-sulfur binding subunit
MWGNVASINPETAKKYGLAEEDVINIKSEKGSIELPVHIQPGIADLVIITELGYGRKDCGRISNGIGSNAFVLFDWKSEALFAPVEIRKTGRKEVIAKSQHYDSTDGRDILNKPGEQRTTNNEKATPSQALPQGRREISSKEQPSLYPGYIYKGHRWGMVIDLDLCTGCNACVTACQVENNIAVVGKEDAAKGRLLHWIRIDRYYESEGMTTKVMFEPMLCQHCEQAPCEPVCPVSASSHSPEGLNETTYNRCVGTRFCMANCPYKVRRFNFRDYSESTKQPLNYAYNPSVTVRMRGVVEKCTFCVQRINAAKYKAKDEGRNSLEDGEVRTACQQACPAGAIIFGDLNDPESMVSKLSKDKRAFRVLEELNTRPAVVYLAKKM